MFIKNYKFIHLNLILTKNLFGFLEEREKNNKLIIRINFVFQIKHVNVLKK